MIETKLVTKHLLRATITRPEALNAVNFRVMDDLEQIISRVEKDEEIRVLLFSGAGGQSFVSGGDLKEFHTIKSKAKAREMSYRMQDILNRLEELPCWNIALVNGNAYGGGIEMMLAFDFRIAAPGVKLGFTQGRFHLTPGWGGLTRLVEKTGRAKALKWLAHTDIISAEQALNEGIIDEILPGEDIEKEALDWVNLLAKNDRSYISALKSGAFPGKTDRIRAMRREVKPFTEMWVSDEHVRRVEEFFRGKRNS